MFSFKENLPTDAFIRSFKTGIVIPEPSIHICQLQFAISGYDDALFSTFAVEFPESLSSSVIKRRAEYLAGRVAAQTLLLKEGVSKKVTLSNDRSPKWPEGWRGSISHTEQYALAVISPRPIGFMIGIDIENLVPETMQSTADVFTTEKERNYLFNSGIDYHLALLIAFSAKESLYKALYPVVKFFFGFENAIITQINSQYNTFTLQLTRSLSTTFSAGEYFWGHYHFYDNKVTTLIYRHHDYTKN